MARPPPRRRPGTIGRPVKRKTTHRPELDPAYVAELRARVDALGFRAVARAGGMGLATLWRVLSPDADQHPTVDAAERVRAAIAKVDPDGPPIPAPFVAVRGAAHAAWCALGAELAASDGPALAALVASPRALRAALRAAGRAPAKPTRR